MPKGGPKSNGHKFKTPATKKRACITFYIENADLNVSIFARHEDFLVASLSHKFNVDISLHVKYRCLDGFTYIDCS